MSDIQTSINWEQAKYGAAQYTNQLRIASRSLSDIAGLTNDAKFGEQSYVGQLERANLLLGRQAQQLQFGLSQRQINLQTALAGFQVPGLTPAEQNARVEEAKVETSYAQKQLDIQRKMFGNQVQIVDITNLRQGVDLLQSIQLLREGRRITLDVAIKQENLQRLQKIQSAMVNEVSTYISSVDSLSSKAIADIAARKGQSAASSGPSRRRRSRLHTMSGRRSTSASRAASLVTVPAVPRRFRRARLRVRVRVVRCLAAVACSTRLARHA